MHPKDALLQKIAEKSAYIGIVGMGYVGLPLMLRFVEVGYRVVGLDVDDAKVDVLNAGESYIQHISSQAIADSVGSGRFQAASDWVHATQADVLILCVPTPLDQYRQPDLTYVVQTMDSLLPYLRPGQLISLESTTYPGTTEEQLQPRLASRGLVVGEDVFLAYSPEREDPANPKYTTQTIPKVCGGATPACLETAQALYSAVVDQVVPMSSTRAAEMTKLLENIHRAVNIGLVNEMKMVADRMGIDIYEIIDAAATKPFGFVPYYPGPGLGGHCIPIDPFYLTWKAREYGLNTRFIELAGEVNNSMPEWVISKVADGLNERSKSVRGSRVLILGIAYKKNVDDMRESPSVAIMERLRDKGADIAYSDPHVPVFPRMRQHHFELENTEITVESIAGFDCVVLATDHDGFDYSLIRERAKLIVDTRGVYRNDDAHILKA